jgi:hypothetical protein
MNIQDRISYSIAAGFFPETYTADISERSAAAAFTVLPPEAYSFYFYKVDTDLPEVGEHFRVESVPFDKSPTHYVDGVVYTKADVEKMGDEMRILLSNMEGNGWSHVIKCNTGGWQPFDPREDILVFSP